MPSGGMAQLARTAVLGAGSLGSLWAARLAKAGVPVSLLLRSTEKSSETIRLEHMWSKGREADEEVRVKVEEATAPGAPLDCVLLATKGKDAAGAVQNLAPRLAPKSVVVVMCNGALALREELVDLPALRSSRLVLAATSHGSWRRSPFHIVHAGWGQSWFGLPGTSGAEPPQEVRSALELLGRSGLCEGMGSYSHIEPRLWQKLAMNAVLNPLTALWTCRNGEVLSRPEFEGAARQVTSEIADLAAAMGYRDEGLEGSVLYEQVIKCAEDNFQNYSSMYQDMAAGRETEIKYLNSWIARKGAELGVPVPKNAEIAEAVLAKQAEVAAARKP